MSVIFCQVLFLYFLPDWFDWSFVNQSNTLIIFWKQYDVHKSVSISPETKISLTEKQSLNIVMLYQ